MQPDDFFAEDSAFPLGRYFDTDLATALRRGPISNGSGLEVAIGLARLVHEELEKFGAGGGEKLTNVQMSEALLALRSVVSRLGAGPFDPPFREFRTFRNYWIVRALPAATRLGVIF